mgnify:CR=1 FL=1
MAFDNLRLGRRYARHALLPEHRGVQAGCAHPDRVDPRRRRRSRRRWHGRARCRHARREESAGPAVAESEILSRARELGNRVRAARTAPIGEEHTGPVLLEGQASAEIVAQSLLPALLARRPESGGGRRGGGPGGGRGGQVTPFSADRTPRAHRSVHVVRHAVAQGVWRRPVPGAYVVDDYGLHPKDLTLVEKGRLVTLLAGRAPMRGLLQSNGHTRGGDAGRCDPAAVLTCRAAELKRKYLSAPQGAQGKGVRATSCAVSPTRLTPREGDRAQDRRSRWRCG